MAPGRFFERIVHSATLTTLNVERFLLRATLHSQTLAMNPPRIAVLLLSISTALAQVPDAPAPAPAAQPAQPAPGAPIGQTAAPAPKPAPQNPLGNEVPVLDPG